MVKNLIMATPSRRHPSLPMVALAATLALGACAHQSDNGGPLSGANAPQGTIGPNTLNVADAAIAGGNPGMALSVSQSILSEDPNNVNALVHEGDAYYALDRCPAAQAAFQLALKYDAKSSLAETGLGRCLLKTDPASAEAAFVAAAQDDPGNANALNDLGIARDLQGNFAGAVDPYQRALLANPSLTAAEVNLGLSLALSGHGPEALQYLGPLAEGQGATPKIRQDYAAALVASGRDQEARQVLAADLTPDQVNAAMDGFSSLIAASISNPPAPPPPAPTMPQVQTQSVTVTQEAPASAPVASPAPQPLVPATNPIPPSAPATVPAPMPVPVTSGNPNAAYTGPSPIAGAVSSSTPGPAGIAPVPMAAPVSAPVAAAPVEQASAESAAGGGAAVQLGALPSQRAAERAWRKVSDAEPALFNGKSPDIVQANVHGKDYYRLRVSGFASRLEAAKFCAELSASGSACTVANF